jgi:hypothetical protein
MEFCPVEDRRNKVFSKMHWRSSRSFAGDSSRAGWELSTKYEPLIISVDYRAIPVQKSEWSDIRL